MAKSSVREVMEDATSFTSISSLTQLTRYSLFASVFFTSAGAALRAFTTA